MAPKVLVSDSLSETAVQIFRDRGIDVDFMPKLGKDKDALAEIIGNYDGLAIRSATKVTAALLEKATNLKVVGRAGIGTDNVDKEAASKHGVIVMNTPFGNMITTAEHAIAMMFAVARQIPEASESTHAGKWEKSKFMGVELTGKVRTLTDGEWVCRGPMYTGVTVRMGPTAVLETGGMQIVVVSQHHEPWDTGVFTSVGIDPLHKRYLLLKSRIHYRAGFAPIGKGPHITLDGVGVTTSDNTLLDYQHVRRPIYPLDEDLQPVSVV